MSGPVPVYLDEPLRVYLDDAASGKPAPGGGSVSACVGALGAALVAMVCNLTVGREKFAAVDTAMRGLLERAEALRSRLQDLLQEDTVAYSGVIAAYRLPKESEEQRAARQAAIQDGLRCAAAVPLETARVALEVCRLALTAAEQGNPQAVTDAGIAALLGEAAVVGAALNVRINLGAIEDEDYVRTTAEELDRLEAEAAGLRQAALAATRARL